MFWCSSIGISSKLQFCMLYSYKIKGALHELNQMVNLMVNHLVKRRRVARDVNPWLKLT